MEAAQASTDPSAGDDDNDNDTDVTDSPKNDVTDGTKTDVTDSTKNDVTDSTRADVTDSTQSGVTDGIGNDVPADGMTADVTSGINNDVSEGITNDVTDGIKTDVTEPTDQGPLPAEVRDQEKGINWSDVPSTEKKMVNTADDSQSDEPEEKKPAGSPPTTSRFVLVLTFFATLGGFLMGYDIGIVSGSMLFIRPFFHLSTFWTEAIVSGAVGAAAVSAITGGWIIDTIGRRLSLLIGSVIFTVGGVVMGAAPNKEVLLIGRITCGLGIGLASVVVPVYVAEASPVHVRGRLTIMWQMMINLGILLSSLISAGFSYLPHDGWRYMLGLSALPGLVQFIGCLFMPESPRWLVDRGRSEQARHVLARIRGYSDVTEELQEIEKSVEESKAVKSKGGFHLLVQIVRTPPVRRALVVGMGLLIFQQFCGINTAIYYSGTVLKMAGFPAKEAVWLVVLPNALLFLAGLAGIYIVDRIGRRPLLIWSMVGTIVGLVIIAIGFQLSETHPPTLDLNITETMPNGTVLSRCHFQYRSCSDCIKDIGCGFCMKHEETSGSCLPAANEERSLHGRCNTTGADDSDFRFAHGYCPSDTYSWITTLGVALFVFLFSPGMAPMPWTLNAEIYPLWARGTCTAIAATTCWVSNLIISFTFLTLTEAITTYGAFWMFTGLSLLGLLFFVLLVPETRNKSLEQVEELFTTSLQLKSLRAARAAPDVQECG
ncbi:proton myo-inositol cotransporter-like [Babylonia areolata]|uniref:proton myo-inositol cotransporter-like n=1 Tax=Babylonia areolata TaxID=304850 RepID=UPI003FD29FBD